MTLKLASAEELRLLGVKRDELVEALSDAHAIFVPDEPAEGFSVPFQVWPGSYLYVTAKPWIRGWSVHVSSVPHDDWQAAPSVYQGLCQPVHNQRRRIGPWLTDSAAILNTINKHIDNLLKLSNARLARYNRQHWPQVMFQYLWAKPASIMEPDQC